VEIKGRTFLPHLHDRSLVGRSKTGVSAEVDALAIQLQVILEKMAAAKASQDG
jgi:hypothetical protein